MYPKNNASPERLAIGQVVLIADGTVQTSGVAVTVRGQGGAEAASGGTIAYGAEGTVYYTPTQAETNYTSFVLIASKASCLSASINVVTTESATAGHVRLEGVTHTSAVIPTVTTLTGHTAQTGDNYARLGAPAGASVSADIAAAKVDTAAILADTGTDGVVVASGSKTGYALSSTGLDAIAATATGMVEIAKAIWDRVLNAANHNVASSAGRRLRTLQTGGNYEGGMVWVDTVNGVAGTTVDENGVVTNPVSTWADALTISAAVPLNAFHIANGSTITLTASSANYVLDGHEWTLALGGQDVTNTRFDRATNGVSGTCTGTFPFFKECSIGAVTAPPAAFDRCGFTSTLTVGSAGDYHLVDCFSQVAGTSAPVIDMGAAVGATSLNIRRWSGGLTINNIASGDVISVDAISGGTITLNGADGSVSVRGMVNVVDNRTGSPTLVTTNNMDARLDAIDTTIASILTDTDEIGAAGAGLTALATQASVNTIDDFLDTEIAAIKAKTDSLTFTVAGQIDSNILAVAGDTDAVTRLERVLSGNATFTIGAASSTTSIVTSAMSPAAAVTDQFKGRILTFDAATTTANLRGQSTDITASTALGVLTVTALTTSPVSGDTGTIS